MFSSCLLFLLCTCVLTCREHLDVDQFKAELTAANFVIASGKGEAGGRQILCTTTQLRTYWWWLSKLDDGKLEELDGLQALDATGIAQYLLDRKKSQRGAEVLWLART